MKDIWRDKKDKKKFQAMINELRILIYKRFYKNYWIRGFVIEEKQG